TMPLSAFATEDNAVTRWVGETLETVRVSNIGAGPAGRLYAMSTVAMYDAVNGIDRASNTGPRRDHALVPPDGARNNSDREVAAAAAAHAVLTGMFPAQAGRLDDALQQEILLSSNNHGRVQRGLDWGQIVGQQVLELRANDGSGPEIFEGSDDVGRFPNDWNGGLRNMVPFGINDPSAYISAEGPPALDSNEYAVAVYRSLIMGAPDGNPDNDAVAAFWRYGSNSIRETGGWFPAALEIARQEGTTQSISDTARLFALLGMATADSVIVTWNEKALHLTWRPFHAIRRANEDGNPLTDQFWDPNWVSRFGQVGGSPEWTSGQSSFAGAGPGVISAFYCRDNIAFSFNAGNVDEPRSYNALSEAGAEAVQSRILQGNHFEFSNSDARSDGQNIADEIVRNHLQRLDNKPAVVEYCPQF
ncbi:MAG: vanadium-dependent haloperoxidase, partial [Wenzhouxiangellaceae bacterium]